jgi:hypothetical protein
LLIEKILKVKNIIIKNMPHYKTRKEIDHQLLIPKLLEGKALQAKIERLKREKGEDYNIILQIKKFFEPRIQPIILQELVSYYNIELGGLVYKTPRNQIINLQKILDKLNTRRQSIGIGDESVCFSQVTLHHILTNIVPTDISHSENQRNQQINQGYNKKFRRSPLGNQSGEWIM